ncbi:hypothetical protein GL325_10895 [Aeromicrobium sp. 636]|uniref:VanZ family protein n=1 Tax=Aeromicrobium senzhongii TaxID=2663859 RepID=A0A8I0EXD4_9ACTN|nr:MULTISPECIES: VanZ family protein [Aeromicrobium]MBC9226835.1 VanZ family protein [Aeromicrobium senzhongii]MCQ3998935.1 hypothetical protein [Aeromicrobium sp. 636]
MESPPRPHGPVLVLAGAYAVLLALVGLWPDHVDSGLGLVDQPVVRALAELLTVTPTRLVSLGEVLANLFLFVPVGVVVAYGWPRARLSVAGIAALAISAVIETVQWAAPIDRTASALDLVVNTAGGCLGFVVVQAVSGRQRAQWWVLGSLTAIVLAVCAVLVWGLVATGS